MAGHSKWANIQHRKGKQDQLKGKILSRCAREIMVAAKTGADPAMNPRLRLAIEKARIANMTREKIENAVKKGSGNSEETNIEELRYEGYGPGGVAVIVDCMSNNRNRTAGEVRHAFSKCGGQLGTDGSVSYLFNKRGLLEFAPGADEAKIMDIALEAGADDVITEDDSSVTVYATPEHFAVIKQAFENAKCIPDQANITMVPTIRVKLDKEGSEKMLKLLDMLEELDDTQEVYSNADLDEESLQ
jgi:YebC/PmpR family DNA-binding regulatory protein